MAKSRFAYIEAMRMSKRDENIFDEHDTYTGNLHTRPDGSVDEVKTIRDRLISFEKTSGRIAEDITIIGWYARRKLEAMEVMDFFPYPKTARSAENLRALILEYTPEHFKTRIKEAPTCFEALRLLLEEKCCDCVME